MGDPLLYLIYICQGLVFIHIFLDVVHQRESNCHIFGVKCDAGFEGADGIAVCIPFQV